MAAVGEVSDSPNPKPVHAIAVCALGVALNVALAANLFLPHAWGGRNDFVGNYAGMRLAGTGNLYDRDSHRREQLHAIGEAGETSYVRLPAYAMALKPLAWLGYRTAYVAWEILSAAAFLGFLTIWPERSAFTKWFIGCWSLPAFVALLNGQDDLLLLLWVALSVRSLRAGRPLAAGIVLAPFMASKYHLFVMVPVVLLAQRRWRMLAGTVVGGGCVLGASFAVAGRDWPLRLYALLADSRMNPNLDHMPNLHSLLAGAPFSLPIQIAASLLLAIAVYFAARQCKSLEIPLGLALAVGVLVGYHGYLHDAALFLPALISFYGVAAAYVRLPTTLLVTPVPWCILHLAKPFPAFAQLLMLACVAGALTWLLSSTRLPREQRISDTTSTVRVSG